jgi:hypothetical protein
MGRQQGAASLNDRGTVGFKRIRGIIIPEAKEELDEKIPQAVENQFDWRVVFDPTLWQKARAKGTFRPVTYTVKIRHYIIGTVGPVRHDDCNSVACHHIQTTSNRVAEPVRALVLNKPYPWVNTLPLGDFFSRCVRAAIIDYNNFVANPFLGQPVSERVKRWADITGFVPGGNDKRKFHDEGYLQGCRWLAALRCCK